MTSSEKASLSAEIGRNLPYLRRYGRALTGSQSSGDRFAAITLEALLQDLTAMNVAPEPKVALFHAFHRVWTSAGSPLGEPDSTLSASAQGHMMTLTPNSREALLLNVIEGFTVEQIAAIMQIDTEQVANFINIAAKEMEASVAGSVLVIEDEAIIALDIVDIVRGIGHRVTGTARTHVEAVDLALHDRPDLILADIQLADKSSGIEAVNEILVQFPDIPVIFITAFPERLLTGERPEPAFLITKPFTEDQVRSAVGQAMFFASTETLSA
ncbi:response regulator [Tabrizicola sp.]|uniref:response regulator n=1 Tax=Tabrizicola sp. TaxID=2005166 RepID=UPI00286D58C2|nr:response regulator [Tabrizicola sp.]